MAQLFLLHVRRCFSPKAFHLPHPYTATKLNTWSHEKKKNGLTFHYTGCLIGREAPKPTSLEVFMVTFTCFLGGQDLYFSMGRFLIYGL